MSDMKKSPKLNRRMFLAASSTASTGLGAAMGLGMSTAEAGTARQKSVTRDVGAVELSASDFGVVPNRQGGQTKVLQDALNAAAKLGATLRLAPGIYAVDTLELPDGTQLVGTGPATRLISQTPSPVLTAKKLEHLRVANLAIDGHGTSQNLLRIEQCHNLKLSALTLTNALEDNVHLVGCGGTIQECEISGAEQAGLHALGSAGLSITDNTVQDCANNGIQIWRTSTGADNSLVTHNRIMRIRARDGGTGQNGNGINIFRAANVLVAYNHISDCDYSAIRANAASNIQITSNQCHRIGEVALYAEFGFQGALIANNVVDTAATGISVTNFNDGGRLAVVQGNLIRNLFRREQEPQDQRGNGIVVEADATVSGNTIEDAPTSGITVGWGPYMRNVAVTGNVVRLARYGILISSAPDAGACLVANNMISETQGGAIRAHNVGSVHGADLSKSDTHSARVTITSNVST